MRGWLGRQTRNGRGTRWQVIRLWVLTALLLAAALVVGLLGFLGLANAGS